jgi:hypothetical protein
MHFRKNRFVPKTASSRGAKLDLRHLVLFGLLGGPAVFARGGSFLLSLQFLVFSGFLQPIALGALEAVIRSERHGVLPSDLCYDSH